VQIVSDPDGHPVAVSDVEPGSTHDLAAARATGFLGALYGAAALLGLPALADKGYAGAGVLTPTKGGNLHPRGADLLRLSYRSRAPPGQALLAPIRQLIESVYDTLTGQLGLELHGGRTLTDVAARVAQRLLTLTAVIWHNRATGQPISRSLIAYDH
jgi:DDE superfamily endonuclease